MRMRAAFILGLASVMLGGCAETALVLFGTLLTPLHAEAAMPERTRWAQDLFPALDCRPDQALDAGELSRLRLVRNPVVPEGVAPQASDWQGQDANGDGRLNQAEFVAFLRAFPGLRQVAYDAGPCVQAPPSAVPSAGDAMASYFQPVALPGLALP